MVGGSSFAFTKNSIVVSNPLESGKPTLNPCELFAKKIHKPDPAHQKPFPGICPSKPEDEQENQEEKRDRYRKNLLPAKKVLPALSSK
ncbi:hypothetical protein TNCV_4804451 [Trichonephila clavipes]|nr:hypothetical protein TNCV_4804451 [Trichonephila clavipes]